MPPPLPSSSPPLPSPTPPRFSSSPPRPSTPEEPGTKTLPLRSLAVAVDQSRPIAKCRQRKQHRETQQQQQQQSLVDINFEPVRVPGWGESELAKLLLLLKTEVGPMALCQLCAHLGRESYGLAATIIHLRQAAEKAAIARGLQPPRGVPNHLRRPIVNPMPDGRFAVLNDTDETAVVLYETVGPKTQTSVVYYVRPGDRFSQLD